MKIIYIFIIIHLFSSGLLAQDYINQRYDRQRIMMSRVGGACNNLDTNDKVIKAGTLFDFNSDTLKISVIDTLSSSDDTIKFYTLANVSQICNKDGRLTAYFNGGELWNRYGEKILLNIFYNEAWGEYSSAYSLANSVILPYPNKENTYVLINTNDFIYDPISAVPLPEDFSAIVFKEKTDGRLEIIETIPKIHQDKYMFDGAITACRHANGRDWWLVCPRRRANVFSIFLLDPQGVRYHHSQTMEANILYFSYAPIFSPDGRWYTRTESKNAGNGKRIDRGQIFPFDRCTGLFSEPFELNFPSEDTTSLSQILFDKTSRFFYLMRSSTLYQGDIEKPVTLENLNYIGSFNPKIHDNYLFNVIGGGFLGPDNKIYTFDGRNSFGSSVINYPSLEGENCGFEYSTLWKPSCTSLSTGNMPDFNLGPIDGSPCDTLGLDNPLSVKNTVAADEFTLYPNPNSGILYGVYDVKYNYSALKIFDFSGRPLYSGRGKDLKEGIDLRHFVPGVYFVSLEGPGVKKVVKI